MKITYLRLKNFNAIYTVLNMRELKIDFEKMMHDIVLFIGTNGSCKTYILSNLHPFAYVGNVDARSGVDMIIKGEDGEKEIHFRKDNGDEYKIHHHYIYQKSGRKIKSYIEKNGVEMNATGLVRTFNEIIELEFGIDIGFLRVIRLGSNVNNLVSMKSSERKEFAVKLLSEVDDYLADYKNASDKSKSRKSALKIIVDKIKRLNIDDVNIFRNDIDAMQDKKDVLVAEREDQLKKFYKFKGEVESKVNGTVEELTARAIELRESNRRLESESDELDNELSKVSTYIFASSMEEMILNASVAKVKLESELTSTSARIDVLSEQVNELSNDKLDLEAKIKQYNELDDSEDLTRDLDYAKDFDAKYVKYYKDFTPKCTKEDILEDISTLQTISNMINGTREFSKSARDMFSKHYTGRGKHSVRDACTRKLVKLSTELSLNTNTREVNKTEFASVPFGCKSYSKCFYYKAYTGSLKNRNVQSIEADIEVVRECMKISEAVNNIGILFNSRKKNLPYKVEWDNIVMDIVNDTDNFFCYDEARRMVTFLEKYTEWKSNQEHMDKLQKDLDYRESQRDKLDSTITTQLDKVTKNLNAVVEEYHKLKVTRRDLIDSVDKAKRTESDLGIISEVQGKKKKLSKDMKKIHKELDGLADKEEYLRQYNMKKAQFDTYLNRVETSIKDIEDGIYQKRLILSEYTKFTDEKVLLEESFEDGEYIRDAVSTTKGIPLLYMKVHLAKTRQIANKIISSVYGDSLKLAPLIIDDKEFRIPYLKNDTVIDDIVYASQGEQSIISIALSFALIQEFSGASGYNILLLDEVDGPLDKGNKQRLLQILEARMKDINCHQVFMITHNQLFENYPVDVFITTDKDNEISSFKNINVLN